MNGICGSRVGWKLPVCRKRFLRRSARKGGPSSGAWSNRMSPRIFSRIGSTFVSRIFPSRRGFPKSGSKKFSSLLGTRAFCGSAIWPIPGITTSTVSRSRRRSRTRTKRSPKRSKPGGFPTVPNFGVIGRRPRGRRSTRKSFGCTKRPAGLRCPGGSWKTWRNWPRRTLSSISKRRSRPLARRMSRPWVGSGSI